MSDAEEDPTMGPSTRMQRLREELLREQQTRNELADHVKELESQVQRLQTLAPRFEEVRAGQEPCEEDSSQDPILEENQPSQDGGEALTPLTVHPLNEEGLQGLTKLYQSMGESHRLQGVSLSRPANFSGLEVVEDPYALTHWYREVSC